MVNVFDLETFEENNKVIPYCLCAVVNGKEVIFYGIEKSVIELFIFYLVNEVHSNFIEVYVHNLNFDGILVIEYLTKSKLFFEIKSIKTNIYWIKIHYLNKLVLFRCSYKILPLPLKKIGEIEKFPKMGFPYKFVNSKNLEYVGDLPEKIYWEDLEWYSNLAKLKCEFDLKKETIKYCINDVYLVLKFLMNLIKIIEQFGKKVLNDNYSSPSISHWIFFNLFNNKGIKKKIKMVEDLFIRSSYFGGRCEVFGNLNDREHVKYYDFKGMYAQAMREQFHVGDGFFSTKSNYTEIGFHKITFNSENMDIPILPIHSKTGKLLFLNGINTGTYWYEEIIYFVKSGGVVLNVHSSFIFKKKDYVFNDFVSFFEKIREKMGYYNVFGKLMINSLYGSMGLKNEKRKNYITHSDDAFADICKNLNVSKFYKINNVYVMMIEMDYKFKKIMKHRNDLDTTLRNVSYASAIASKARIKLHSFFKDVSSDGGRILYTDTDSVFASYPKNDTRSLVKNEVWLEFYDDGVFAAPKTYALINNSTFIIKIKGINVKKLQFEDFKKKFYNNESILFETQKINAKRDFILMQKNIQKKINLNFYDKRVFDDSKKYTTPIKHSYSE